MDLVRVTAESRRPNVGLSFSLSVSKHFPSTMTVPMAGNIMNLLSTRTYLRLPPTRNPSARIQEPQCLWTCAPPEQSFQSTLKRRHGYANSPSSLRSPPNYPSTSTTSKIRPPGVLDRPTRCINSPPSLSSATPENELDRRRFETCCSRGTRTSEKTGRSSGLVIIF